MRWLLFVAACGSSSHDDGLSQRVAGMQAVPQPFTLEVMGLDPGSSSADRAKRMTSELRAAVREYRGVTVVSSGKHLVDLKLLTNCEGEAPHCMATIAKSLPADRMLYGRIDRSRVELRLVVAGSDAVREWTSDQLGIDDAGLRVTAREAIQSLLAR